MIRYSVMANLPVIDDFGDTQLNRLARDYRNALNDRRPPFGNIYLLELVKPVSIDIKYQLTNMFNDAIKNKARVKLEEIDNILETEIPDDANY